MAMIRAIIPIPVAQISFISISSCIWLLEFSRFLTVFYKIVIRSTSFALSSITSVNARSDNSGNSI